MHEEALLRDLRRALGELAVGERPARIVRARVWLGALSHVSESRLRDAWEEIVRGGPADGCAVEVETSSDPADPLASAVVLRAVDLEDGRPGAGRKAGESARGRGRSEG